MDFWEQWAEIGKDLIEYGQQVQYGMSLIEVKFMAGKPVVIIRSKSIKTKYSTNDEAKLAVAKLLEDSEQVNFEGARTFTVAYHEGKIKHLILDQYGNDLIK